MKHPPLVAFAILTYSAIAASNIRIAWFSDPFLKGSVIVFTLWTLPAFLYWLYPRENRSICTPLLLVALLFSTLGILGDLYAFTHLGLISAIMALIPFRILHFPWAVAALTWTPATAYLLRSFDPDILLWIRLAMGLAIAGGLGYLTIKSKDSKIGDVY